MPAKPHGTFITDNGNRKVQVFEIPDDELDEYIAALQRQHSGVKEEQFKDFVKPKKDD